MSAQGIGALLCGLGGGLILGAIVSHTEATSAAELRAKNRYEEQLEMHKRTLERQRTLHSESPAEAEEDLVYIYDSYGNKKPSIVERERREKEEQAANVLLKGADWDGDTVLKVGGEIIAESSIGPELPPDYVGTAAQYADPGTFINGEQVLSLEYIEAEDYEEEDGRAKEQITIFMGADEPIFVMDGEQIENWAELIGDHILVDFYQKVPPGEQDRVLYVRNHKRDEDYEVWQTVP